MITRHARPSRSTSSRAARLGGVAMVAALALTTAATGCRGSKRSAPADGGATASARDAGPAGPRPVNTVTPPLPLSAPPADAATVTGIPEAPQAIVRVAHLAPGDGPKPGRNDVVTIHLDGWRTTGETFLTTRTRRRPIEQSLSMMAPGFAHAVTTLQKGEKAMIWVPPEVGYLGTPEGTPEQLIYQVELVDFRPAPPTPPDVAGPPATAASKGGVASLVVRPGTGRVRPRIHDGVTFHYTGWSSTGRIFDSSELRQRPKSTPMYREWPGIEQALSSMVVGERRRVWLPRDVKTAGGDPLVEDQPGLPDGPLCFELELLEIKPGKPLPPPPPDVAGPPADAQKTPAGVFHKVLVPGTGTVRPTDTDIVEVEYTGWTSTGRPFDSTAIRGVPTKLVVSRAIAGWTDGLKTMVAGQTSRLWIPQALAFQGAAGQPRGTLVFDLKLLRIVPPAEVMPAQAQPPLPFGSPPPGPTP